MSDTHHTVTLRGGDMDGYELSVSNGCSEIRAVDKNLETGLWERVVYLPAGDGSDLWDMHRYPSKGAWRDAQVAPNGGP